MIYINLSKQELKKAIQISIMIDKLISIIKNTLIIIKVYSKESKKI